MTFLHALLLWASYGGTFRGAYRGAQQIRHYRSLGITVVVQGTLNNFTTETSRAES